MLPSLCAGKCIIPQTLGAGLLRGLRPRPNFLCVEMVKITVDKSIPALSEEEIEEAKECAQPATDADFKRIMLGTKEVVISPQVEAQLKELGITTDELIAMMLKQGGAAQ